MAEGIVGEFFALKEATQADLLAMQMGDFYEFFGEDAEIVGETLDLKVSKRSSGGEQYSMAGVPIAELAPYLNALVERGFRVAVADQQPEGDGFVRRIDRVVTPGTLVDPTGASARYLATALQDGEEVGLAFLDVTTGEFQMAALTGPDAPEQALTELYRFTPTELLPGRRCVRMSRSSGRCVTGSTRRSRSSTSRRSPQGGLATRCVSSSVRRSRRSSRPPTRRRARWPDGLRGPHSTISSGPVWACSPR